MDSRAYFILAGGRARIDIIGDSFSIGKSPKADCELKGNPTISRMHALVIRDSEGYMIDDLGSLNHTYLNGRMVTGPSRLCDGDVVMLANVEMRFHFEDDLTVDLPGSHEQHEGTEMLSHDELIFDNEGELK